MLKNSILFIVFTVVIYGCHKKSRENSKSIQTLQQLLVDSPDLIQDLNQEISKEEAELATQIIHENRTAALKTKYEVEWQNETLLLGDYQLKFKYKKFGEKLA